MQPLERHPQSQASAPCDWPESKTLFLLNCYDIWSATPPRGCLCGDPAPAPTPEDAAA